VNNSSKKDNIKLSAKLNGTILDEVFFSVRTWPENFRRISTICNPMINGVLEFIYTWDSESGNPDDLNGIIIGEWVDYPGDNLEYEFSSPPYTLCKTDDPYIELKIIGTDIFTQLPDRQRIPCGVFYKPVNILDIPRSDNFTATQYYWFRDPIFMNTTFNWQDASSYDILMGPLSIYRFVYKDTNGWRYRVEKHGCQGEMNIPQFNSFSTIPSIINLLLFQ